MATKLKNDFKTISDIILCGIAGGIPSVLQLGDVVVSTKGVFQYDLGKNEQNEFIERDQAKPCRPYLLQAIQLFKADELEKGVLWTSLIKEIDNKNNENFNRPANTNVEYYGISDNGTEYVKKSLKIKDKITVHYGKTGAANCVQKDPKKRDQLNIKHNVLAIEMEGAGIRDASYYGQFGYLVIRGICDYCDPCKNDDWHNFAAATAAAFTKALLESIPVR
jgi:nucleoside phosphorylase